MKKRALLLVSLLTLGGLVACQNEQETPDVPDEPSTPVDPDDEKPDTPDTPAETYTISVSETNEATLTPSKTSAAAGERVDITVSNLPEGKEVESISTGIDGVEILMVNETHYYFLMPNANVTLTITLKDEVRETYTLTFNNEVEAEIVTLMDYSSNEYEPVSGDEFNPVYELTPNEGYLLRLGNATTSCGIYLDGELLNYDSGYYSFFMPPKDTTLDILPVSYNKAEINYDENAFSELYVIDIDSGTPADPNALRNGQNIAVSYSLNSGYIIEDVQIDGVSTQFSGNEFTFTMPSHNITIDIITRQGQVETPEGKCTLTSEVSEGADVAFGLGTYQNGNVNEDNRLSAPGYYIDEGTTIYFQVSILRPYQDMYVIDTVTLNGQSVETNDIGVGSFVITENTTIKVTTTLIQRDLSFDAQDTGSTCVFTDSTGATRTTAGRNEVITATFTNPDSTKELDKVFVNGEEGNGTISGNTYTFTMGTEAVTLTATWKDKGQVAHYKVDLTDSSLSGADIAAYTVSGETLTSTTTESLSCVAEDTTIALDISKTENGVKTSPLTVLANNETCETMTGSDGEKLFVFTVADSDVTLTATWLAANHYSISFDDESLNGTTINVFYEVEGQDPEYPNLENANAEVGSIVYMDIAKNVNETWKAPTKVYANDILCTVLKLDTTYFTFTMPAENVVITAEW